MPRIDELRFAVLGAIRALGAAAFYGLVPFLGTWLAHQSALSGVQVGLVVGTSVLFTRAGALLMPRMVGIVGERRSLAGCYGAAAVTVGLFVVCRRAHSPVLCGLAALLGLAFSGATVAIKSLAAAAPDGEVRLRSFSLLNVATNVGAAAGPLLGAALVAGAPVRLPAAVAGLLLAAASLSLVARPAEPRRAGEAVAAVEGRRDAARGFLFFLLSSSGTRFAYAQVFNVLPALAAGTRAAPLVPVVFAANAVLIILFQLPLTASLGHCCASNPARQRLALAAANALLALGLTCFWLGAGRAWLWLPAIGLFTAGEVLWSPMYDEMVVRARSGLSVPAALGYAGFVWGLAESAGAVVGTALALGGIVGLSPFAAGAIVASAASVSFLPRRIVALRDVP